LVVRFLENSKTVIASGDAYARELVAQGLAPEEAREKAAAQGQTLFPARSLYESLGVSARVWRTWAMVWIYFTTFGGFIGLTAWFPTYWRSYFGVSAVTAGLLTGAYSIRTSLVRIVGGMLSDELEQGGENTATLALLILLAGSLVMVGSQQFELAVPGIFLLAVGMGLSNAAVFKLVPQTVPHAVGRVAGWVGGTGRARGLCYPAGARLRGPQPGKERVCHRLYSFRFLGIVFALAWILKYARETPGYEPSTASLGVLTP
jgi:NNP family nitrate/nitrite transporter-like MFS transporter